MDVVEEMLKNAQEPAWLEKPVFGDLRVWQIVFLVIAAVLSIVIALCCCMRFRVPRTKQQIEANYQRRILTKKFRQQLEKIQNSQMDSIDLKMALEIIRVNLKSDQESEKDQQRSASLISSIVSPVQSFDEASFKSTNTLNNKQQAEPQTNEKPSNMSKFGNRFITIVSSFRPKTNVKAEEVY